MKMDDLASEVFAAIDAHITKRIEAHERQFSYFGSFEIGKTYAKGNFVSHQGSIWHCEQQTTQRPGGGNVCWRLAVKGTA